jgi:alpha-beta hydrolase superfamily lysophospholipase
MPIPEPATALPSEPRRRAWAILTRAAAGLAILALLTLASVGWIASERAIHPTQDTYRWTLADYPALHPLDAHIKSRTGASLAVSFFPGARRSTIVLSHGYGDNGRQMLPWADFLHRAGFAVITYDMRGRGGSDSLPTTLGALEEADLSSVIDYAVSRADVDPARVGVLGLSLGGATSLLAAADDRRIAAVVSDSAFAEATNVIASSFEHFIGLPAFPFAPVTVWIAGWRAGVDVSRIRPADAVHRIGPRPLLLIHCLGDTVILPRNAEEIFAAARQPKQLWMIPGGRHIRGHDVASDEYERRVNAFFNSSLAGAAVSDKQ